MEFMSKISGLFNEYTRNGLIDILDKENLSECDKCKLVTEKYLECFTQTILPNHKNIKCYVPILEEEKLLISISDLTGVSIIDLKQYFKELGSHKIDEKDVSSHHDSFQYDGKVHYCRVSAIADDICKWIGPCRINEYMDIITINHDGYTTL